MFEEADSSEDHWGTESSNRAVALITHSDFRWLHKTYSWSQLTFQYGKKELPCDPTPSWQMIGTWLLLGIKELVSCRVRSHGRLTVFQLKALQLYMHIYMYMYNKYMFIYIHTWTILKGHKMGGVHGGIWDGFGRSKGLILSKVIIHMYEVLKEYIIKVLIFKYNRFVFKKWHHIDSNPHVGDACQWKQIWDKETMWTLEPHLPEQTTHGI